jgi:hypothetical protein
MKLRVDSLCFWLARKVLSKTLVYFCGLQIMAESTTGQYSNTVAPELTGMDAIKRYGDLHGL